MQVCAWCFMCILGDVWFEGGEVVRRIRRACMNVLGVGKFGVLEYVSMCGRDMISECVSRW